MKDFYLALVIRKPCRNKKKFICCWLGNYEIIGTGKAAAEMDVEIGGKTLGGEIPSVNNMQYDLLLVRLHCFACAAYATTAMGGLAGWGNTNRA